MKSALSLARVTALVLFDEDIQLLQQARTGFAGDEIESLCSTTGKIVDICQRKDAQHTFFIHTRHRPAQNSHQQKQLICQQ